MWSLKILGRPVSLFWAVDGVGIARSEGMAILAACRSERGTQVVLGLSAARRPDSMLLVNGARPQGRAPPLLRTIRCSPSGLRSGVEHGARQQVGGSEIPLGFEIPWEDAGYDRTDPSRAAGDRAPLRDPGAPRRDDRHGEPAPSAPGFCWS
jgi:hypothetical protein